MSKFTEFFKSMNLVEKPGNSTHSAKWDRCIEEVKASGKGKNAYAICTAAMGDESFKSMDDSTFDEKIKTYLHKLGIAGAGPIPNSLLSKQDLVGPKIDITRLDREWFVNSEKSQDINNFAVWYYDSEGARKCAVFGSSVDAEAYARIVEALGYKDVSIMKGQVEVTDKKLEEAQKEAEEAENKKEVKSITERIKNIQLKRQKAILNIRGLTKSFKQKWSEIVESSK